MELMNTCFFNLKQKIRHTYLKRKEGCTGAIPRNMHLTNKQTCSIVYVRLNPVVVKKKKRNCFRGRNGTSTPQRRPPRELAPPPPFTDAKGQRPVAHRGTAPSNSSVVWPPDVLPLEYDNVCDGSIRRRLARPCTELRFGKGAGAGGSCGVCGSNLLCCVK